MEFEELRFRARLRPKGVFGWPCGYGYWASCKMSVRTYLTAAVPLTGIRLPASPRSLPNSSTPPEFEVLAPRVAVLATVEPWDYDAGTNNTVVGLAFQGGLGLLDLGKGEFNPSTLVGMSFLLPIAKDSTNQFGTSVAVGAFYERDLAESDPELGNHLTVHLGLNIGTLLAGSQKP